MKKLALILIAALALCIQTHAQNSYKWFDSGDGKYNIEWWTSGEGAKNLSRSVMNLTVVDINGNTLKYNGKNVSGTINSYKWNALWATNPMVLAYNDAGNLYWYEITSDNIPLDYRNYLTNDDYDSGEAWWTKMYPDYTLPNTANITIKARNAFVAESFNANGTTISLGCRVLQRTKVVKKNDYKNRNIKIFYNGTKVYDKNMDFPTHWFDTHKKSKNGACHSNHTTDDIELRNTDKNKYTYEIKWIPTTSDGYSDGNYEVWIYTKYTVKFNANGGTGDMAAQDFVYGTSQNLNNNKYSSPQLTVTYDGNGGTASRSNDIIGATFKEWKDTASNTTYSNNQNVNNLTETPGGVITLDAQWVAASPIASLPTATWEGHDFIGWYTSAIGGEKISTPYSPDGNTTLYAHWETNTGALTIKCDTLGEGKSAIYTVTSGAKTWTVILNNDNGFTTTLTSLASGTYTVTEKKWADKTETTPKQATINSGGSTTVEFTHGEPGSSMSGEASKTNWKKVNLHK